MPVRPRLRFGTAPVVALVGLIFTCAVAAALESAPADADAPLERPALREFDVVVYGGTPSGIAAATNAGRQGLAVALVEETYQVGGLTAGGLAHTDFRTFQSLGGSWKEFMDRVQDHYRTTYGEDSPQHRECARGGYYEPHVARDMFMAMLNDGGVHLFLRHQLTEASQHGRVVSASFVPTDPTRGYPQPLDEPAITLKATVFIDATYEGDLLAKAGVPYRVGADAREVFGEPLAPEVGNDFIMATNFRVCLTLDPDNRVPLPKPENYDRSLYARVIELIEAGQVGPNQIPGPPWPLDDLIRVRPVPNSKADFNDKMGSPISIKLIEETHAWLDAGPEQRGEIFDFARDRTLGMFWFLANDPELPEWVREGMAPWGLPADEFLESGHWTPVLYLRQGRRLRGVRTFTQHDTNTTGGPRARLNRDAVAIGDYSINSHGTHHREDGTIGGVLSAQVLPWQVPYHCLVSDTVDAILAPVPVSASHVGYSAIRMEPSWTALGQAAGLAAAQAIAHDIELRDVLVPLLQMQLHQAGAYTVYLADVPPSSPVFHAAQFFGTHGFFHELTDDGASDEFFSGPPVTGPNQWRNQPFARHAVLPDEIIDPELAASWRARHRQLFPENPVDDALLQADGELTRGDFLNRLFDPSLRPDSAEVDLPPARVGEVWHHSLTPHDPAAPRPWVPADLQAAAALVDHGLRWVHGSLGGLPDRTGQHQLTVVNQDADGRQVRRLLNLTVLPPRQAVPVAASTYIKDGEPNRNFGDEDRLGLKNYTDDHAREIYLRFDLTGFNAADAGDVIDLVLELTPVDLGSRANEMSIRVERTLTGAEHDWDESGLSWNHPRPALANRPAVEFGGPFQTGTPVVVDLTPLLDDDERRDLPATLSLRLSGATEHVAHLIWFASGRHANPAAHPRLWLGSALDGSP